MGRRSCSRRRRPRPGSWTPSGTWAHAVAGHGLLRESLQWGLVGYCGGGRPVPPAPRAPALPGPGARCSCRRRLSWPFSWWRPARIASGTCSGPIGSRRSRPSRSPASSLASATTPPIGRRPMARVTGLLALTWAAQLVAAGPRRGILALGPTRRARPGEGRGHAGLRRCPPRSCASCAASANGSRGACPSRPSATCTPCSTGSRSSSRRAWNAPGTRQGSAWCRPPPTRLRRTGASAAGLRVGGLEVQAECSLVPLVEALSWRSPRSPELNGGQATRGPSRSCTRRKTSPSRSRPEVR